MDLLCSRRTRCFCLPAWQVRRPCLVHARFIHGKVGVKVQEARLSGNIRENALRLSVSRFKHAAVFLRGEKTVIQALDRLDPVLPLSPGRMERHGRVSS